MGLVGAGELQVLEPLALLLGRRGVLQRMVGERDEVIRADQLVLAAVDAPQDLADHPAGIATQVVCHQVQLTDALQQHQRAILLGGPHRRRQQAVIDSLHTGKLTRERVERRDPQRLVRTAQQRLGPCAQLLGGMRAERQRQDLIGLDTLVDEPGQAVGQDPRLAGPGARDDQQRSTADG